MIKFTWDYHRKIGGGLVLIFLVGALFSGCATDTAGKDKNLLAMEKFQQALQFSSLNMRREAIEALQAAVEFAPEKPVYHHHLATAYFLDGQLDKAEREYLETLKQDPDYKDAYRQLGRLYMRKEDWAKAAQNFEEDLSRPGTPLPHRVYNWLALSYYNQGIFEAAESEWLNALRIKENADIRLNISLAYKNWERFDLALESLKKAVSLRPSFPQAHYELALLYLKDGKKRQAIKHFEEVVRLSPAGERTRDSRRYLKLIRAQK